MTIEFIDQGRPGLGPPAPVTILQEEKEFAKLLEIYRERKPKRVLEVGSYAGGTFFHWLQNSAPGTVVVSVDTYEGQDNSASYPDWCGPGVTFAIVRGDSNAPSTAREVEEFAPFDWIFIDAGHLEENVRADWRLYGPMAAPGGLVVFDDIVETPEFEVYRLWRELTASYGTEEIWAGGSGLGILHIPEEDG